MIKKALVLGYFGFDNNQLDGQTVKTRTIYELLKSKEKSTFQNVEYFDTQRFQRNKLHIIKSFKKVTQSNILYYLPAQNNLRFIFPIIYILCKLFNVKIHYIVVGGWLGDFLKGKPIHKWMLSNVSGIYPQTSQLTENLKKEFSFNNVLQLQNFRITNFKPTFNLQNEEIKLVFMARIHPLKGVQTLFELEKELQLLGMSNVSIDVYGPIYSPFEDDFNQKLAGSSLVKYKGILQTQDIYSTLEKYDLLLFPTQFFTEGFPGTILDAYISKVPVIVTKWKYATEFVEDNVSGKIVKFNDSKEFINETIKLIKDREQLITLKEGTQKLLNKFSAEEAWKVLKSNLNSPS